MELLGCGRQGTHRVCGEAYAGRPGQGLARGDWCWGRQALLDCAAAHRQQQPTCIPPQTGCCFDVQCAVAAAVGRPGGGLGRAGRGQLAHDHPAPCWRSPHAQGQGADTAGAAPPSRAARLLGVKGSPVRWCGANARAVCGNWLMTEQELGWASQNRGGRPRNSDRRRVRADLYRAGDPCTH